MKKWLMLVLLGMFVTTAIVGCGKPKDEETEEPEGDE
jgi:hypothetical protein